MPVGSHFGEVARSVYNDSIVYNSLQLRVARRPTAMENSCDPTFETNRTMVLCFG